jgi:hypothetical protein
MPNFSTIRFARREEIDSRCSFFKRSVNESRLAAVFVEHLHAAIHRILRLFEPLRRLAHPHCDDGSNRDAVADDNDVCDAVPQCVAMQRAEELFRSHAHVHAGSRPADIWQRSVARAAPLCRNMLSLSDTVPRAPPPSNRCLQTDQTVVRPTKCLQPKLTTTTSQVNNASQLKRFFSYHIVNVSAIVFQDFGRLPGPFVKRCPASNRWFVIWK